MPHQEIANGIAQIYKDVYGRGPDRIVATITDEVVFVVLSDLNTPAQHRLVELGEIGLLNTFHSRVRRSLERELAAVVEAVTGRKVQSYVPGYNGQDDVATDAFVLEPQPGG